MVIYNKNVEDSSVYNYLRQKEKVRVVVCDNSTVEQNNQEIVNRDNGWYVALPDNGGLAKAYNAGIRRIFSEGAAQEDYVVLFDDDSTLEENYFEILEEAIYRDASDIFLPVVEDGIGIMSPARLQELYCKRIRNQVELLKTPRKKLTGINSGMAVKLEIYKKFSYDEEFFMDYIDHDFILKMRKKGVFPKLMDTHIVQNFSAVTDTKEQAIDRFGRQRKDLQLFYNGKRFGTIVYNYVVIRKRLKLFLKYHSFEMLYK